MKNIEKYLKRGQASLEYFILFAIIAGITLLGLSGFLTSVRNSAEDLFQRAVNIIAR